MRRKRQRISRNNDIALSISMARYRNYRDIYKIRAIKIDFYPTGLGAISVREPFQDVSNLNTMRIINELMFSDKEKEILNMFFIITLLL